MCCQVLSTSQLTKLELDYYVRPSPSDMAWPALPGGFQMGLIAANMPRLRELHIQTDLVSKEELLAALSAAWLPELQRLMLCDGGHYRTAAKAMARLKRVAVQARPALEVTRCDHVRDAMLLA
jgi:hypothetical protein